MNEKFAHTPGPWVAAEILMHQRFIEVIHRDQKHGAASTVIARVTYRQSWANEQFANARLIAAAPTMLDALHAAEEALVNSRPLMDHYPEAVARHDQALLSVRAAIAKALAKNSEAL